RAVGGGGRLVQPLADGAGDAVDSDRPLPALAAVVGAPGQEILVTATAFLAADGDDHHRLVGRLHAGAAPHPQGQRPDLPDLHRLAVALAVVGGSAVDGVAGPEDEENLPGGTDRRLRLLCLREGPWGDDIDRLGRAGRCGETCEDAGERPEGEE